VINCCMRKRYRRVRRVPTGVMLLFVMFSRCALFTAASSTTKGRAREKTWNAATAFRLVDNGIMATRCSESAAAKFFAPIRHWFYLYEWTCTIKAATWLLSAVLDKVKFRSKRTDKYATRGIRQRVFVVPYFIYSFVRFPLNSLSRILFIHLPL